MSSNPSDPTPPKAGGLWARLFGMGGAAKTETEAPADPSAPTEPEKAQQEVTADSPAAVALSPQVAGMRIKDRYEITTQLSERGGINRYAGLDHGASPPRPVAIVQATLPELPEAVIPLEEPPTLTEDEILPTFEDA